MAAEELRWLIPGGGKPPTHTERSSLVVAATACQMKVTWTPSTPEYRQMTCRPRHAGVGGIQVRVRVHCATQLLLNQDSSVT